VALTLLYCSSQHTVVPDRGFSHATLPARRVRGLEASKRSNILNYPGTPLTPVPTLTHQAGLVWSRLANYEQNEDAGDWSELPTSGSRYDMALTKDLG